MYYSLSAQNIVVKDRISRLPIVGAAVFNTDFSFITTTDALGVFAMDKLTLTDSLTIRSLGYETLHLCICDLSNLSDTSLYLEPSHLSLNDVVITANRWEQPEREVPQTSIKVSPQKIARGNPQTSADLLAQTGAVFVQKSQQGGGSPMIRGFATNRVLISVDQVRMNNAIFRSGNLQNVISIDPLAVEQVEVLFGPGSLLYGSDAIGGVMNFTTLQPNYTDKFSTGGKAIVRGASANNELTQHFDIRLSKKKWSFISSVTLNKFGDLQMGSKGPDDYLRTNSVFASRGSDFVLTNPNPEVQLNSAYSQMSLLEKVGYKVNDKIELVYAFQHSATSNVDRYDRLLRTRDRLPRSAAWYYGPQIWTMHHLKLLLNGTSKLYDKASLNLAYQSFQESRNDRDLNDPLLNIREERVHAYSASFDFNKSFSNRQRLVYGIEYVFNDVKSKGSVQDYRFLTSAPAPSRYPQAQWNSMGAYANYLYKLSTKVHLETGLRYSHFLIDAQFDTSFYPLPFTEASLSKGATTLSGGIVWAPQNELKLSFHYSSGFRAPNVDDIGKVFDSEPGSVVVPNPDLEPEYAHNLDLGLAYVWNEVLKVNASVFFTYLDQALVRRNFQLNGADSIVYNGELSRVQAIQNVAQARVYGALVGLEYRNSIGISAYSNLSYQYGEEELDDGSFSRLRHAAPWFGKTSLGYQYRALTLEVYAAYSGGLSAEALPLEEQGKAYQYAIDANGRPYSPSWTTYNTRVSAQFKNGFLVTAGLENISNVRYRPYSSGLAAAGRNFILSAQLNF